MDSLIDVVLFAFLLVVALAVARGRDLFAGAMLFGMFSLLSAGLFLIMDAADVAFTEAAVGAGVSTVLLVAGLSLIGSEERSKRRGNPLPLLIVLATGAALIWGILDLPAFGDPAAPANHHVVPRYLERSGEEIGIPNVVASVLASYRGFDTLGEVVVIFAAGVGVLMLLSGRKRHRQRKERGL
ncbi:MAG: DUF4040 domain-containing protein [Xanthomonadales bacterium]|nr:DUF4040 domain-containing protein [Xanthomonadales bacterium]